MWRLVTTLRALTASTIPQVYVDGEFLGGCDVMIEMYQNGELQEMLDDVEYGCHHDDEY